MKSAFAPRLGRVLGVLTACLLGTAARSAGAADPATPEIRFEKVVLDNGMTVVLHEDHTLPIVVVDTSFWVGSRFEEPGRTGFAHLFEHLMFMGTKRVPTKMFDAWMESAGGWNNAWTSEDRTNYYDVGPPTALDLFLWLEADRLTDLGGTMTKDKLDAQRDVVRNERRQTSENQPYGKVELRLPELLWPDGHPYHHPVIGSHKDLEAASVDDVVRFWQRFYDPGNAVLVVAGDFPKATTLAKIKAMFGAIPTRKAIAGRAAKSDDDGKPILTKVVRETIEDNVELSKLVITWSSPRHFGPGDADLDLASAILAGGKSSRLYKSLVYDKKLAQSVHAAQESGVLASRFTIEVLLRPGTTFEAVEKVVDEELDKITTGLVSDDELTRARTGLEVSMVKRLESVRERASLLAAYQAETGDPGYLAKDLGRYRGVTRETLRDVAKKTLPKGARVIVRVVPKPAPKGGAK